MSSFASSYIKGTAIKIIDKLWIYFADFDILMTSTEKKNQRIFFVKVDQLKYSLAKQKALKLDVKMNKEGEGKNVKPWTREAKQRMIEWILYETEKSERGRRKMKIRWNI